MKKRFVVFITVFILLLSIVYAQIQGITISDTDFLCGNEDGICPSDYAGEQACTTDATSGSDENDPECCAEAADHGWTCTTTGVVCGDVATESLLDEMDSEGETVDSSTAEDCSGTCTDEQVIDDSNDQACWDSDRDQADDCADDGVLYDSYTTTSSVCEGGVSCHDTDVDGDSEVCENSRWHDPDEDEDYCIAVSGEWKYQAGTDTTADDYDGDLSNGYCDGDDGFVILGAVVEEIYRGSESCEAAGDVTITIKDVDDPTIIYATTTTVYSTDLSDYEHSTDSALLCASRTEAGLYTLSLDAGTYYLVAEKTGYNTHTQTITITDSTDIPPITLYLNAECQSDCTMNDNVCYAACAGINGCAYNDYTTDSGDVVSTSVYCDGQEKGSRYEISSTDTGSAETGTEVYCCTGIPQTYTRTAVQSVDTNCVENIIAREKSFIVNGEPLTLHFVVFSDPQPEKAGCEIYEDFMCEMYGGGFCS